MEVFYDLVGRLIDVFDEVCLDYAFTGALAASFYGLPRTTTDVDVMVEVTGEDVKGKLASGLSRAGLIVDEREIDKALKSDYGIATFRDGRTSYSVDVIFSKTMLERREGIIAGRQAFFQMPENLILAKLRMIRATVPKEMAMKDVEDVRAILRFAKVDVQSIRRKARENGTLSIFEDIVAELGKGYKPEKEDK